MPFHGVKLDDFHVCVSCILTPLLCLLNEHLPSMLKWLVMQATMRGVACRAWPKTCEAEKLPQPFILRTGLDGPMTTNYVNCWSIFFFVSVFSLCSSVCGACRKLYSSPLNNEGQSSNLNQSAPDFWPMIFHWQFC